MYFKLAIAKRNIGIKSLKVDNFNPKSAMSISFLAKKLSTIYKYKKQIFAKLTT